MRALAKNFVVDAYQWKGGGEIELRKFEELMKDSYIVLFFNQDGDLVYSLDDYGTLMKVEVNDYIIISKYGIDVLSEIDFNNEYEELKLSE